MSEKPVHLNVDCPIDPPTDEFGEFANSFRYIVDGNEVLLDFCIYSARDNKARVVSRVRIPQELFPVILKRLSFGLTPDAKAPNMVLYLNTPES